ncbi:MAG: hypothetical protein KA518_01335 [Acinetobacter sp.]|nr:hypothetical protein [Acinetobacter sp.]MBP8071137.1 hypothetical protein [Acinetobacter sp.]
MLKNTKHIVARIGETDQLYLENNTPELALERAQLRFELVKFSQVRQEQIHFLQEGIVLLEQARIEYEEIPMSLYLDLSLALAQAYMQYYDITKEKHLTLIAQQILKPLTSHNRGDILLSLAHTCAEKKELALTRHWLTKYSKTADFDLETLKNHSAFDSVQEELWFSKLIQSKLH